MVVVIFRILLARHGQEGQPSGESQHPFREIKTKVALRPCRESVRFSLAPLRVFSFSSSQKRSSALALLQGLVVV